MGQRSYHRFYDHSPQQPHARWGQKPGSPPRGCGVRRDRNGDSSDTDGGDRDTFCGGSVAVPAPWRPPAPPPLPPPRHRLPHRARALRGGAQELVELPQHGRGLLLLPHGALYRGLCVLSGGDTPQPRMRQAEPFSPSPSSPVPCSRRGLRGEDS